MAKKEKYDKSFIVRCNSWVYDAFQNKHNNVNEAIRQYMEDDINNISTLEEKEKELLDLKSQFDFLGAKIKTYEREIKKEKELENNLEVQKERLNKAIEVCISTYKASNKIGVTLENIKRIAKQQKTNYYLLIEELTLLEEKEEIKILNKYEIEREKRKQDKEKRESKYKPELTPLIKVFNRINNDYKSSRNNIFNPEEYLEKNKDYVETQIQKEEVSYNELKEYFLENHSEKKSKIKWL